MKTIQILYWHGSLVFLREDGRAFILENTGLYENAPVWKELPTPNF